MLNDEIMDYMLNHVRLEELKKSEIPSVKTDIDESEALKIFNEILDLLRSHNISYQCACRICISLTYAFMTGAVELYRIEQNKP